MRTGGAQERPQKIAATFATLDFYQAAIDLDCTLDNLNLELREGPYG
jgi:hypothetical protein